MGKRVLLASHDPGGANLLAPLASELARRGAHELVLALLGPAQKRIEATGPSVMRLELASERIPEYPLECRVSVADVRALFDRHKPELVLTGTSYNSNLEYEVLREANARGLQSAALLDFWGVYTERFVRAGVEVLPRTVFVCDQQMRREFETLFAGKTKVVVAGNPHLQKLAREAGQAKGAPSAPGPVRIRFFTQNIKHYFPELAVNEFHMLDRMLAYFERRAHRVELIVRPHPMEDRQQWEQALASRRSRFKLAPTALRLDELPFPDVLRDAAIAVGISSMALFETAVCGTPTYSYQIDLPVERRHYCLELPFGEYGIAILKADEDFERIFRVSSPSERQPLADDALTRILGELNL